VAEDRAIVVEAGVGQVKDPGFIDRAANPVHFLEEDEPVPAVEFPGAVFDLEAQGMEPEIFDQAMGDEVVAGVVISRQNSQW
jgi:hypothetical protein